MARKRDEDPPRLSTAAYAILGLLELGGSQTTYELKRYIDGSIGYFWPFPHSQLYAETRRLEDHGLIRAEEEQHGRRRRNLHLTDQGKVALADWRSTIDHGSTEIRDIGLLRLFCADPDDTEGIAELASRQLALHVDKLAEYEDLESSFGDMKSPASYTLRLGLAYEQIAIEFWESVRADLGGGAD